MRLLKIAASGEVSVTKDSLDDVPAYATLSHTWSTNDDDEVTFVDMETGRGMNKTGYRKIRFCEMQAAKDGLQHFWVDTCCINKANHSELSEAITSMFRWYQGAAKCYVYLSDVSSDWDDNEQKRSLWKALFRSSKWFRRGWTLQELLAPTSVEFFSREGRLLGSKKTLEVEIHEITRIPIAALRGEPLSLFAVDERLRWADGRHTKKMEDKAYCLLGIFNIFMPLMYGEGENASKRLKEKIGKRSGEGNAVGWKGSSHVLKMLKTSDYERSKMSLTKRVNGTCEWFVQNVVFQIWRQKTTQSLLWYSADPGCGKTTLARYVVDEVFCASPLTLYFFFQRHNRRHKTLSTALCALLHQLYRQRPHLLHYAEKYYKEVDQRLPNAPTSLWRLFQQSVANSGDREVICVLDALDECGREECKGLFRLLLEEFPQSCYSTVKFLITSRPYHYIQQLFRDIGPQMPVSCITGDTESKFIIQDVETFIHGQVSRLDLDPEQRAEVEKKLVQKQNANHTFLWAFLITEQLLAEPPATLKKILAIMDKLPHTVLEAYDAILRNCPDVRKARKILSVIIAAREPLTLDQMDVVLALEDHLTRLEDLDLEGSNRLAQTIRHTCGLFVRIADSKIHLIHQTARDFLLCSHGTGSPNICDHRKKLSWQCSVVKRQSHFELASACIKFLRSEDVVCRVLPRRSSIRPFFATSRAEDTGLEFSNIVSSKHLIHIEAFAAYAIANWTFHVIEMLQYMQAYPQNVSIERLLGLGLDLQMVDADGRSVLHRAVDVQVAKVDMELVKCVLEHGGLVDTADHYNMTCMHYAVLRCHEHLTIALHRAGFDINKKVARKAISHRSTTAMSRNSISAPRRCGEQHGLTPLHAAAFFGREDILPFIIDQGADVNAQDEYGHTPIHLALSRHLEGPRVEDLWEDNVLQVEHVWEFEEDYTNQILSNARETRASIVEMLCEHPMIDLNVRNNHGKTPLHSIRYSEGYAEKMVELLVQKGADRTAADDKGRTPIHVAARAGDVQSLAILVKNPEDLNLRDKQGRSALHLAAQSGDAGTVLFVLQNAASPLGNRATDSHGRNALHHSLHSGSKWLIHPCQEVLNILLGEGVSATHLDQSGMDPLAYYMTNLFWNADTEVISSLLMHGASLQYQDDLGRNLAHHLARVQEQVELTTLTNLEKWGIDIQMRDQEGKTILHHAAISGSVSISLLRHLRYCQTLDLDAQDDKGVTAIEYARKENCRRHHPHMFRPNRWKQTIAAFSELDDGPQLLCSCVLQQ